MDWRMVRVRGLRVTYHRAQVGTGLSVPWLLGCLRLRQIPQTYDDDIFASKALAVRTLAACDYNMLCTRVFAVTETSSHVPLGSPNM